MSVMLVLSSPHPVVDMAKAADWVALTNLKYKQKIITSALRGEWVILFAILSLVKSTAYIFSTYGNMHFD